MADNRNRLDEAMAKLAAADIKLEETHIKLKEMKEQTDVGHQEFLERDKRLKEKIEALARDIDEIVRNRQAAA